MQFVIPSVLCTGQYVWFIEEISKASPAVAPLSVHSQQLVERLIAGGQLGPARCKALSSEAALPFTRN